MKKMKDFFTKNKKVVCAVSIIIIIILLAIGITVFAMNSSKNPLQVSKKEVVVEYGLPISMDAKDYLSNTVKTDVISQTETTLNTELEEGKEYYPVGEYKLTLTYKDYDAVVGLKVQDTTIPELTVPTQVEIAKDTDISKYDFKSLLEAKDLSELSEYSIDTSKVDATKVGEYEVVVSIEDKWQNKSEKSFKVSIIEVKTEENEEIKSEVVTQEDGSKKVIVKKETKPNTSSSSNPSSQDNGSSTTKPSGNGGSSSGGSSSSTKPSGSGSSSSSSNGGSSSTTKPSGNGSSSSSNNGGSSTTKPSGNGGSSSNTNKEEEKPHSHIFTVNTGKWFKTQAEARQYYVSTVEYWGSKYEKGEITDDEYDKNCPCGYEVFICTCGMRGVNFSYR